MLDTIGKKFGKHLLKEFYLEDSYVNVNHGSFGAPPREVVNQMRRYQEQMDASPERWFRKLIYTYLEETRGVIAKYIKANPEDIAIVENASDGVNAIFKSRLQKGDTVLIFNVAYEMVHSVLRYLKDEKGIQIITLELNEENINSDDMIIRDIENIINNFKGQIKLASIDHISSVPSFILPVKRIVKLLRQHDIEVFIDGAHSIGQIDLDINDISPDYYLSNFHKWAFTPKAAAFLYVRKKFQNCVHPLITTAEYTKGFFKEFAYTGTRDYSAYFAIKDALMYRQKFSERDIMQYNRDLAWHAGVLVSKLWGTEILIKDKERIGSMVNVRVPYDDEEILKEAMWKTLDKYNTYVVIFKFSNKFFTRLSSQIYNDIDDYKFAAEKFREVVEDLKSRSNSNSRQTVSQDKLNLTKHTKF